MKVSKLALLKEAIKHKSFIKKIPAVYRMIKAWRKGQFKASMTEMGIPLLGLIYIISPIDLLPGIFLPGIGVLDDLFVLSFIMPRLIKLVDRYLLWEATGKSDYKTIEVEAVEK